MNAKPVPVISISSPAILTMLLNLFRDTGTCWTCWTCICKFIAYGIQDMNFHQSMRAYVLTSILSATPQPCTSGISPCLLHLISHPPQPFEALNRWLLTLMRSWRDQRVSGVWSASLLSLLLLFTVKKHRPILYTLY